MNMEYGINVKKTKFMVINNDAIDKQPIVGKDITVAYTSSYVYLGVLLLKI